jgi:hypothetical protein
MSMSKISAKKVSICYRTDKMGSGLSQQPPSEPAPDTYAAKMERERRSREASVREGLRSRAKEQRFAVDQSQRLIKKDKF